jgi:hypothetical protein
MGASWPAWREGMIIGALLLSLATAPAPAADAPRTPPRSLEEELLRHAPRIVRYLQKHSYKNVGVLKFQVTQKGGSASDSVGPLNLTLADRLEVALVLTVPAEERKAPGIIRAASATAAKLKDANHLTRAGRKALFTGRYPLHWGKREVKADAFLTGAARVRADLKEMHLDIQAFARDNLDLKKLFTFTVSGSASRLAEAGHSFLMRSGKPDEPPDPARALASAAALDAGKGTHPLKDASAPVSLEVLYDGKPVAVKVAGGRATLLEPRSGQAVTFVIRRQGSGKQRLGIVLKVNGENSLFRQRLPDDECAKWVLEAGQKELTVRGFQLDKRKSAPFVGLSAVRSKRDAVRYGADCGLVTLAVFAERRGEEPPLSLDLEAEDARAVARGVFPAKVPKNLLALRAQLRDGVGRGQASRGLIGPGKEKDDPLNEVAFESDPVPVLLASVRYYKKKD